MALPLSFAHPPPCQPRLQPWPSTTSGRFAPCLARLPALLLHRFASRSSVLIALFNVQAFGQALRTHRPCPDLLCPLLTSACASRHLAVAVAQGTHADLPGYCALTFTLMPVGFTSQPSVQVLGFDDIGRLARLRRLVSASCSSGQRFAFGFLQIRSRPRHPCRSANSSPCRASRGLSPPSKCALPGAPKKNASEEALLTSRQPISQPTCAHCGTCASTATRRHTTPAPTNARRRGTRARRAASAP